MKVSALIADFLQYLEIDRNASLKTIQNYDHYLKRFGEFASDIDPAEIDLNLIRRYRLYLAHWTDPKTKQGLKKITQNYFMIALRALLRYLERINIPTLKAEEVRLEEAESSPIQVFGGSSLKKLLQAPDVGNKGGLRDKALLETLFSTGLRVSELASLNQDSINVNKREFFVMGKGAKERLVFLSEQAAEWLNKYLKIRRDTFRPLFIRFQGRADPSRDGEAMRLTPRSIQRIVEKYVKMARLSVKATPHTLRHSLARDLLRTGVDLKSVQEVLGHKYLSTTQTQYTSVQPRGLQKN